jgi:Type VI secretion system/phage-baseplate injector OB domain
VTPQPAHGSRFFGKYRGKVEQNVDPLQQGRVQVSCPAVLGNGKMSWAMPCSPYAGPGVGLFLVPPKDAHVWVEFEGGNPKHPIYSGCFWEIAEAPMLPALPALPGVKMLKTESIALTLSDLPAPAGGFKLEVNPPATPIPVTIETGPTGLKISAGPKSSIELTAAWVDVNGGALKVI